jgi:hypothetical protein
MHLAVAARRPLLRTKPLAIEPRLLHERIVALDLKHADGCEREVVKSVRAIEVELTQDDMAQIPRLEAKPLEKNVPSRL